MYKDRLNTEGTYSKAKKAEVIQLKDIPTNELKNDDKEDQEVVAAEVDLKTPVVELRRSFRTIRPQKRYSLTLHYILLTNKGEPESYEEAVQAYE